MEPGDSALSGAYPALRFESVSELRVSLGLVGPLRAMAISRRGLIYFSSAAIGLGGVAAILTTRGNGGTLTLAVLPFENATKDESLEYLSDGITESLINSFSQVPKLVVPAVGLVRQYKGTRKPTAAGGELGASAVLEGRIQKRADFLSVEVELIDVDSGHQLLGPPVQSAVDESDRYSAIDHLGNSGRVETAEQKPTRRVAGSRIDAERSGISTLSEGAVFAGAENRRGPEGGSWFV